jgi:hypothetical protein
MPEEEKGQQPMVDAMPEYIALPMTLIFDKRALGRAVERVKAEAKRHKWHAKRMATTADFAEAILQDHLSKFFDYEAFDPQSVAQALKAEGWLE